MDRSALYGAPVWESYGVPKRNLDRRYGPGNPRGRFNFGQVQNRSATLPKNPHTQMVGMTQPVSMTAQPGAVGVKGEGDDELDGPDPDGGMPVEYESDGEGSVPPEGFSPVPYPNDEWGGMHEHQPLDYAPKIEEEEDVFVDVEDPDEASPRVMYGAPEDTDTKFKREDDEQFMREGAQPPAGQKPIFFPQPPTPEHKKWFDSVDPLGIGLIEYKAGHAAGYYEFDGVKIFKFAPDFNNFWSKMTDLSSHFSKYGIDRYNLFAFMASSEGDTPAQIYADIRNNLQWLAKNSPIKTRSGKPPESIANKFKALDEDLQKLRQLGDAAFAKQDVFKLEQIERRMDHPDYRVNEEFGISYPNSASSSSGNRRRRRH